jgi:hypothetical protein
MRSRVRVFEPRGVEQAVARRLVVAEAAARGAQIFEKHGDPIRHRLPLPNERTVEVLDEQLAPLALVSVAAVGQESQ